MGKKTQPILFIRPAAHALKDGTIVESTVEIEFDRNTGTFEIRLPEYMAGGSVLAAVRGDSVKEAVEQYERECEHYSRYILPRLGANKKMIGLSIATEPSDFTASEFGFEASIVIGSRPVLVNGNTIYGMTDSGKPAAEQTFSRIVLLEDTPEVAAKIEALIASVKAAAAILDGLDKTDDPTGYLLAIDMGKPPAAASEPVQNELPLEPPTGLTVKQDDDEL